MDIFKLIYRMIGRPIRKLHRAVSPVGYALHLGVRVGKDCRLLDVSFGSEPYLVELGDHVSITKTQFITHDGGVWVFRDKHPDIDFVAPIKVGNNVFIGTGAIILPGVTIGNNVVIGAGAVVARDIPSNCVAAGVPAKPIKSLDEYYQSVSPRIFSTKGMVPKEKKQFYLKHFGFDKVQ